MHHSLTLVVVCVKVSHRAQQRAAPGGQEELLPASRQLSSPPPITACRLISAHQPLFMQLVCMELLWDRAWRCPVWLWGTVQTELPTAERDSRNLCLEIDETHETSRLENCIRCTATAPPLPCHQVHQDLTPPPTKPVSSLFKKYEGMQPEYHCVTRAPLLYFIRSWVALSFKVVSQSVRHR